MSRAWALSDVAYWVWLVATGGFILISAIPPLVAALRRTYEVQYIAGLVAVPGALTFVSPMAFPVWVVLWIVALVMAIRAPGRESRTMTKHRQAQFMARTVAETRRPPVATRQPVRSTGSPASGASRSTHSALRVS